MDGYAWVLYPDGRIYALQKWKTSTVTLILDA